MRLCNLSDDQLLQHAAHYRKLANSLGASEAVSTTAAGLTAAIEELIDRRAGENVELRKLEQGFAYDHASVLIDSSCGEISDAHDGSWIDPSEPDEMAAHDVQECVKYLDLRGLIERHPTDPRRILIRDESEAAR